MATWATVKGGKIHWLTDYAATVRYSVAQCGAFIDRDHCERIELDGCPVDDPQLCRRCAAAWGR